MSSGAELSQEKRALRATMRTARADLDTAARARAATALRDRVCALSEVTRARTLAAFVPAATEIDVGPAVAALIARGGSVVFPRVDAAASPRLRFHELSDPLARPFSGRFSDIAQLRPGAFGILEPPAGCREVQVEEIEVMLVPGLAFDPAGRRLGYGGGYYDEVAARLRAAGRGFLVGVGFDFQIIDSCPAGPADVAMDCVVTDARSVRCHFQLQRPPS